MRHGLNRVVWCAVAVLALTALRVRATQMVTEFDYDFDAGGELHDFSDGGVEGSKITWQPGGALGSIGCLKVTGDPATAESRVMRFKAADATFAFHYYVHGFRRLRVRFNTVMPEDRAKFGSYSQNFIADLPQDKWVYFKYKLADLTGDLKTKPKGYPELVFKSVTFFADSADEAEPYLLLDNIRLGPEIDEQQVKVRKREQKDVGHEKLVLLDFTDPAQAQLIKPLQDDAGTPDLTTSLAEVNGQKALKMVCKAGRPWVAFGFEPAMLKGWDKYDFLALDFTTEQDRSMKWTPELWDAATVDYHTRATYGESAGGTLLPLHKGVNHILLDLRLARRNGKEGYGYSELRKEDKIDLAALTKFKSWFTTEGLKEDYVVYLNNVRLLQEGALETNIKINLPQGAQAFAFGEGRPVVEGFTETSVIDIWADDKPFGFVKPESLHAQGRDWPDPLTGSYVGPAWDSGAETYKSATFEFRVKAPDGKYLVWLCAGYLPMPNNYIDLNVNGRLLYTGEMTGEAFYSDRWFFRFLNVDYSEKPGFLWRNVVSKIYPGLTVETEVKNGVFFVKGSNTFISALILLPAEKKAEFDEMTKQIETERSRYFYQSLFLLRPANEACAAADKDLLLFAPSENHSIMPWSGMDKKENGPLARTAAPGEVLPFQVALRPFRDIPGVTLSLSDLQGPQGAVIPAEKAELYLKRYLSDGFVIHSWCLLPKNTVDLENALTPAFWLRLRVPADAAPGAYKGVVTASAPGVTRTLPVEIQVYPIKLRNDIPLSVSCFYGPPDSGQFAMFDKMNGFEAQRDQILREQMELMRDYGFTGVSLDTPQVTGLRGSGITMKFDEADKVAKAAKAAGLLANRKQRALLYTLGIGRALGGMLKPGYSAGIGEESQLPGFESAYVSGIMQLVEWSQRNNVPLALWLVDEPRENPNPWNRNLADTTSYCQLAGQVKGATRLVTPMGDNTSGKDYTGLCDCLDIVATHAGKTSAKFIERGMADPSKLELWIYNVGADRLSNGFYIWRVGASGKWEWHFNQNTGVSADKKYAGLDTHNPFCSYEFTPYTVPAPLNYKGALLPLEGLLTMSIGISDYRYLYTLEQALAGCKQQQTKEAEVKEAEQFLDNLKKLIPILPDVKNLEDLAAVGQGLSVEGGLDLEATRKKIAELIVSLQK